ncbi:MAG: cytochrome c family protein [Rhizobium sp.]|nr:MAG: cytochrome c family protein [Rhizobium sp.]
MLHRFIFQQCRTVAGFATFLALFAIVLLEANGALAVDIQRGERIFHACASCHVVDNERNTFGPYLKGVIGRRAGSVPDYAYSASMKAAGDTGLVWDDQALAEFLRDPSGKVPGTKMRFWGLWSSEVEDLIAFLKAHP